MDTQEIDKLENCDPEEIEHVLTLLEKSFDFKFAENELKDVRTFGEVCDIVETKITQGHIEGCTTQQAFYRLRFAIAETQRIDPRKILPDTDLSYLFPRKYRRKMVNELERTLGFKVSVLVVPGYIMLGLILTFIISLGAFFYNWKLAVCGLVVFAISCDVAKKLCKSLEVKKVKDLVAKLTTENYLKIRRDKTTVNKKEITQIIRKLFAYQLGLEIAVLAPDAKLIE